MDVVHVMASLLFALLRSAASDQLSILAGFVSLNGIVNLLDSTRRSLYPISETKRLLSFTDGSPISERKTSDRNGLSQLSASFVPLPGATPSLSVA